MMTGLNKSIFREARQVLRDAQITRLSNRDRDRSLDALDAAEDRPKEAAELFYERYGFVTLADDSHHRFLPMSIIRTLQLPPLWSGQFEYYCEQMAGPLIFLLSENLMVSGQR